MLDEYFLHVPPDCAFPAARCRCDISGGPAFGQHYSNLALRRREIQGRHHEFRIDTHPACRVDDQHERGDMSGAEVHVSAAHGADVQDEPRQDGSTRYRHRSARTLAAAARQGARQQLLQVVVGRRAGMEEAAPVAQPVALAQEVTGRIVNDPRYARSGPVGLCRTCCCRAAWQGTCLRPRHLPAPGGHARIGGCGAEDA